MKIKDLLIPLGLALLTTWAIQYFFFDRRGQTQGVSKFVVPAVKEEYKPLNTEIDFLDQKRPAKKVITEVKTSWADLEFSTDGAALIRAQFERPIDGETQQLTTIFPGDLTERESRCFLVALPEKTPFHYTLLDRKDSDDTTELIYESEGERTKIRKQFTIFKNKHQINLTLTVTPPTEQGIEARIIYPSPIMPRIEKEDVISGIVIDSKDTFEKISRDKISPATGWYKPSLFGSEDRYFVHSMVNDENNFVQRAYYSFDGKKGLLSILEGTNITAPTTWTINFYLGPKESGAMMPVDPRLEKALEYYGVFAPISKFLLMIINWLYKYLHSYGLAIIVLTVIFKLILLPFTLRSEQSMRDRLEAQKKLEYLQRKYKNDPQTLARERAEFIRKHGMPGIGGCLPLLLQIPIFFALSRVLSNSIEFYQASFLWIPDLSAKDPYYILPILVTASMLAQATTADPKQRLSVIAMAFVFGAITATLSSGLALYICLSTALSVLQTSIGKRLQKARHA